MKPLARGNGAMKRRHGVAVVLTIVLLAGPHHAEAQPRRVAVLDFANTAKDPALEWLGPAVAETLTTKLHAVRALSLVERTRLYKVLEEQKLHLADLVDPSHAVKVGKLVGAEQVVLGAYTAFGPSVRFTARFVEVETGTVMNTSQVDGPLDRQNPQGLWSALDQLAQATIDSLNTRVAIVQGLPQPTAAPPSQRIEPTPEERAKLAKAPLVSLTALEAFGKGAVAYRRNAWREALRQFEEATRLDPNYAEAWRSQGATLSFFGHDPEALSALQRALQLFQQQGNEKEVAVTLREVGKVYYVRKPGEALSYYERSRRLSEKLGDEPALAETLNGIGMVHARQGRSREALSYYEQTRALSEKLGDGPLLARSLSNIGSILVDQGRYGEALSYFERSRRLSEKIGDELALLLSLLNLGAVHSSQGQPAMAASYYEKALEIADRLEMPQREWIRERRDRLRQQVR